MVKLALKEREGSKEWNFTARDNSYNYIVYTAQNDESLTNWALDQMITSLKTNRATCHLTSKIHKSDFNVLRQFNLQNTYKTLKSAESNLQSLPWRNMIIHNRLLIDRFPLKIWIKSGMKNKWPKSFRHYL